VSLPDLPAVPRERRRTATILAVTLLTVLVLVALFVALRGLLAPAPGVSLSGGQPPSGAAAGGVTSGSTAAATGAKGPATATTTATTTAGSVGFRSPSGNIVCAVSTASARCDVRSRSWAAPPKPSTCTGTWGQGLQVDAAGASIACTTALLPSAPVLAYGAKTARGTYSCTSGKDGVTCVDSGSGHGFTVAKESYSVR
jgi:hypothetical protein